MWEKLVPTVEVESNEGLLGPDPRFYIDDWNNYSCSYIFGLFFFSFRIPLVFAIVVDFLRYFAIVGCFLR